MLENKEKKFESAFRLHYRELHAYAFRFVEDMDIAEEVVQQVFLNLWESEWEKKVISSLRAYLYRSVHNYCMNVLRRDKLKQQYQEYQSYHGAQEQEFIERDTELKIRLSNALAMLPEKSRTIFEMSRFQELKYQEIADSLKISLKTVEGHMSKVLKHLRLHLAEYLAIFWILLIMHKL
ncbi:RNA polymerase sigma-70 factor [Sphingobacterium shayense]|uniref:RNA polymerase sigma-70 factor n=1 Tax=Sphingobacterium shayense TaxID=626343 RepID=UPI0015519590|nr:RNA polymerase sigma-70 factor [Sphingobacterium shayense]NQD72005.1 RNA polymerase sigma-70 factor [Sphingobacterium shayense]